MTRRAIKFFAAFCVLCGMVAGAAAMYLCLACNGEIVSLLR